jgi:hypothetical protein
MNQDYPTYPVRYPDNVQVWFSTPQNPYPMNFMQAPSYGHQVLVNYQGQSMLQGLSTIRGPFMFPVRNQIAYPITHSIPDPYQQSFINAAGVGRRYYTRKGNNC